MRRTILLLFLAVFCASSCKDTFMFDKMYEDEGVFDLKVRIDNPSNITSSGAKISVTILTDEPIIGRGIAITTEPHSSTLAPLPSFSDDKKFDVDLEYLLPNTTYYVRGYCIDKTGKNYYSLEKSFTTK
ncbi:MAG: hypothetical protein J6S97_05550 [Bacteroidales bacterium]|nr:hypothetical protein [Bacteroidales bacterium]MBP5522004.1 hypothetical protein [Bacteroidales bacterium]